LENLNGMRFVSFYFSILLRILIINFLAALYMMFAFEKIAKPSEQFDGDGLIEIV